MPGMAEPNRALERQHLVLRFGGLFASRLFGRLDGDDSHFSAFAALLQFEFWCCHDDCSVYFVALIHAATGTRNGVAALVTGVDDEIVAV